MDSRARSQRTRIGKWFKEEENAERSRSLRRNSGPVFKHCSLLVNCNRNLKTRPKNHLHGTSYLRLSKATNKAVLLNSALPSLKACCFCFLCSSIFLKPSIGICFLLFCFPVVVCQFRWNSTAVVCSFKALTWRSVASSVIPKEKRDTSY